MRFFLSTGLKIITLLTTLLILIPIGLFLFFNPNDYKQPIADYIQKASGLPLIIQGDISLHYFPWLGFQAHHIALAQAPGFAADDFMHIDTLSFKFPIEALLSGNIQLETLTVEGLTLNLIKLPNGTPNWDYFKNLRAQRVITKTKPNPTSEHAKSAVQFSLAHINIKHANIMLSDQQKDQTLYLNHIQATLNATQKNQMPLSAQWDVKAQHQIEVQKGNLSTLIDWQNDKIDFNHLVLSLGAYALTGRLSYDFSNNQPSLKGEVKSKQLNIKNIQLTNLKSNIDISPKAFTLKPITAELYQGSLNAQLSQDLSRPDTAMNIEAQLNNVQLQPLLADFKQERRFTGTTHMQCKGAYRNGLQGNCQLNIKNGIFRGLDIRHFLSLAQSLLNKDTNRVADTQVTPFGDLSATVQITPNTLSNNNLQILSADFTANGQGQINVAAQTIDYKIQAYKMTQPNSSKPNIPLALKITGPLNHPKVEPDIELYIKNNLQQEVKKQIQNQVEKHIGKIIGEDNPDKGELKEKIEQKIDKGFRKLFKPKDGS